MKPGQEGSFSCPNPRRFLPDREIMDPVNKMRAETKGMRRCECAVECTIEIFCVCISDDPSRMTQN